MSHFLPNLTKRRRETVIELFIVLGFEMGSSINSNTLSKLHLDALPKETRNAFLECVKIGLFSTGWYLAGGTALALQVGHRQSLDLDFFTAQKSFDEKKIEEMLSAEGKWKTTSLDSGTIYGEFYGAKMSLIAYHFFRPADPFLKVKNVSIMTPTDIAPMKITAISQRGKKRDFVDLYWLSKNIQPLEVSIARAARQYTILQNQSHILKSLVYFADAEDDPMPTLFFNVTWKEVKSYFQKEVPRIAKKLMGLD